MPKQNPTLFKGIQQNLAEKTVKFYFLESNMKIPGYCLEFNKKLLGRDTKSQKYSP